jgi:hypothetical protein
MAETLREKQVAMQREYDLAAYSAKLERMECGHLRAELGLYIYDRPGSPPGNAQVCLGCLREQRLVQVVVERAAGICNLKSQEQYISTETRHAMMDADDAIRKLASPENIAEIREQVRKESQL